MKTNPIRIPFAVLAFVFAGITIATADPTAIIPAPVQSQLQRGQFVLAPHSRILADANLKNEAELLATRLRTATGYAIKIKPADTEISPGDIVLTMTDASPNLGDEGYELFVTTNRVVIRAPTSAGVFYGEQSFLQLLPAKIFSHHEIENVPWAAACVEISDQPRFPWRGFMLDVSRHFFTKTEVEQVLDLMALYKLNTFHWHLVDDQGWRIQIKRYPKLTSEGAWRHDIGFKLDQKLSNAYDWRGRYGGYYTQNEIREVVAYAAARHITIVPEIEMPGHSIAALSAYPQFGCPGEKFEKPREGGVFNGVYCAGNDNTFTFLSNILAEVTVLFPGKFIHVGGDEVDKANWKQCALCQARIKSEGLKNEKELESYFIGRIEKILNAQGKRLIGWSEIREGGISPTAGLMDWIGGGGESAASGHDVVMTTEKYCYLDHYQSTNHAAEYRAIGGYLPLKSIYEYEPMPADLAPDLQKHVLGAQANLWTEYIPNISRVEYMMFPRLAALSEVDWSPAAARNWPDFQVRAALNEKRLDALHANYRSLAKPD